MKPVNRPLIAISPGDPAGIGPEVAVKALVSDEIHQRARAFVVCDARVIERTIELCRLPVIINIIREPSKGLFRTGWIDVLDIRNAAPESFSYGMVSEIAGRASFEYILKVIGLAMEKKVDATVTGPVNKEALHRAGVPFAGHTEIFAHYTGTPDYAMMLADHDFRVVHVNTHVSMLEAIRRITRERVYTTIKLTHQALTGMGIARPRIAVNGLNPHAGENGLFGTEELEHIIPAIELARQEGMNADGPHPPDTIFPKMRGGQYDAVVCMYHDQGHIPVKLIGFRYDDEKQVWESISGVNITLGLPIIRVSVDHGTAFDRAGKGVANPESMLQAILCAARFSSNKK